MAVTVPSVAEIDSVIQSMRRSNATAGMGEVADVLQLSHDPRSPELILAKGIEPRLLAGPIMLCCDRNFVLAAAAFSERATTHTVFADTWETLSCPEGDILHGRVAPLADVRTDLMQNINVFVKFDHRLPSRLSVIVNLLGSSGTDDRIKFFVHGLQHDLDTFFQELTLGESIKWFDGKTYEVELSRCQASEFIRQLADCVTPARLLLDATSSNLVDVRQAIAELRQSLGTLGVYLPAMADVGAAPATLAAECCRQVLSDRRLAFLELRSPLFGQAPLELLGRINEYFKGAARLAHSETMQAVLDGRLPTGSVRPQSMLRPSHYDTYYRFRDREVLGYGFPEVSKFPYWLQFDPGAFDAGARLLAASGIVEYVLAVLRYQNPGEKLRWLDIGCGSAQIMNLVRPERIGIHDFEFVGLDASEADIEWARRQSGGPNRTFYVGNAFALSDEIRQGGFHLVTMFEFIEHVEDPISLIRAAKELSTGYVLGGSPCDELVQPVGATVHLWSFNKQGFIEIFRQAGLDVTLANQMEVGSYASGQDWLTCLGSKQRMLRDFKRSA